jgi:hypothetical protein
MQEGQKKKPLRGGLAVGVRNPLLAKGALSSFVL